MVIKINSHSLIRLKAQQLLIYFWVEIRSNIRLYTLCSHLYNNNNMLCQTDMDKNICFKHRPPVLYPCMIHIV